MIGLVRATAILAGDTFARAWTSRLSALMLAGTALCVALCLSVSIAGGTVRDDEDGLLYGADGRPRTVAADPSPGTLTLAFGLVRVPLFRDGPAMVTFLHVLMSHVLVGAAGTLLFLVWTSGLIPELMRPGEAVFALTRPVSLRGLVAGQALGVVLFVASQAGLFVVGTWAALGVRTGVWSASYLGAAPLLALNFVASFGAAVLLGIWTRSGAAAALGGVALWLAGFFTNEAHTAAGQVSAGGLIRAVIDAAYWVLPKPGDVAAAADRALNAGAHLTTVGAPPAPDAWHLALIAATALAGFGLLIEIAARVLDTQEA
jgi:hypothetical protein